MSPSLGYSVLGSSRERGRRRNAQIPVDATIIIEWKVGVGNLIMWEEANLG